MCYMWIDLIDLICLIDLIICKQNCDKNEQK